MSTYNEAAKIYASEFNKKYKIQEFTQTYHTETEEENPDALYMAGCAPNLLKVFYKMKIPEYTIIIHAFDGFDLLGGYCFYMKLLEILGIEIAEANVKKLAIFSLGDVGMIQTSKLYEDTKYPEIWKIHMN